MKFTDKDFLQGLDFSCMFIQYFNNVMETCDVIHHKEIAPAYMDAINALNNLYQVIGKVGLSGKKSKKRRSKNTSI